MKKAIKKTVFMLLMFTMSGYMATAQEAGDIGDAINAIHQEKYAQAQDLLSGMNTAESNYYLGDIFMKKGEIENAKAAFQKGIQLEDKFPLNYVGLGRIDLANKNAQAAETNFTKAKEELRKNVRDPRTYIEMMKAYGKAGMYDKAIEYGKLADAVETKTPNADLYITMGDIYAKRDGINLSNSVMSYEKAIAIDQSNPKPYVRLAVAYYRAKQSAKAQELIEKAISIDPKNALAYKEKANMLYLDGELAGAIAVYESDYLELTDNSCEALTTYIQMLFLSGNPTKADQQIEVLRQKCAGIPQMDRMEGISAYETGDYQKAMASLEKFVSTAPTDMHIPADYIYLAKTYAKLDMSDKAIAMLDKIWEVADTTNTENIMKIYDNIGGAYLEAENYELAAKVYQEKISKFKPYEGMNADKIKLGQAYAYGGNMTEADAVFADVLKDDPDHIYSTFMRAQIHAQQDAEMAEGAAKPYYERVIVLTKSNPTKYKPYLVQSYKYLGSYYYTVKKDIDKTIEFYQKWLQIDPANTKISEAIEGLKEQKAKMAAQGAK